MIEYRDFGQTFRKISNLVKIFENLKIGQNLRKWSILDNI